MNNDICEVVVIADRSGSMSYMIDESRNSINRLIDEQRDVDGVANFTFAMFDDQYEIRYDRQDIQTVGYIGNEYAARGTTALYDAIGKTLTTIQEGLDNTPDNKKAGKVIVAIVTDGAENASKEYNHAMVKALIEEKKKQGWEFLFFGANIDAKSVGASLSIAAGSTVQYAATLRGISDSYSSMSAAFTAYRSDSSGNTFNPLKDTTSGGNS